jgi:hypothetical protein
MNEVNSGIRNITVEQQEFHNYLRRDMQNMMTAIESGDTSVKEDRALEHIKAILQPSVDPLDTYQSIAKRRVPGTGDWVRREPSFQGWAEKSQNPMLWISGNPGNGKSFIAQNIISYVEELNTQHAGPTPSTHVGYFFFKDTNPETRSVHRALRDMAFQIHQNDGSYRKHVDSRCHSLNDIKTISSTWRTLFAEYYLTSDCKNDSSVYLILDGIDESFQDDREIIFELLLDLV